MWTESRVFYVYLNTQDVASDEASDGAEVNSWRKFFKEEDQCLFQPVRPLLRLQINFFIIILDPNEASYVLPYVVQS